MMGICYKLKKVGSSIKNEFLNIELGFKIYTIVTYSLLIATKFVPQIQQIFKYTPTSVVQKFEFWRLFSSTLTNGQFSPIVVLFLLINLWFLNLGLREIEKKYSTPYIVFEIIKQNFLVNMLLTLIYYPLIAFEIFHPQQIFNQGTLVITMNFVCQIASRSGQNYISMFCVPLKLKYMPWLMLLTLIGFFGSSMLVFLTIFIISMLQHYGLSKPLLALPLGFYQAIERVLPTCAVEMAGYVKVFHAQQLPEVCGIWCKNKASQKKKFEDKSNFQQHWKEKEFDPPVQSKKIKQSEHIPAPVENENLSRPEQMQRTQIDCDTTQSQVLQSKLIDYKQHWRSKYQDIQEEVAHPYASQNYNESIVIPLPQKNKQYPEDDFNDFVEVSEQRSLRNSGSSKDNGLRKLHGKAQDDAKIQQQLQQVQKEKKPTNASKVNVKVALGEEQDQWY